MTTTINTNFGSWIAVAGFYLNNAMTNFALPEDGGCLANSPAGNKRPETAMAPVVGTEPGAWFSLGRSERSPTMRRTGSGSSLISVGAAMMSDSVARPASW